MKVWKWLMAIGISGMIISVVLFEIFRNEANPWVAFSAAVIFLVTFLVGAVKGPGGSDSE